jgi:two-component system CheB/CheR fusion protein
VKKQAKGTQQKPSPTVKVKTPSKQEKDSFPIVGIGASAGGLEALEQFLSHVPAQSGIAFVIIQHLDPTHKGILTELLQRDTAVRMLQAKDRMKVEPDHAYVIPPNKDMSILHGVLHLFEPSAPRGFRLPIDFFFRSLADDRKEKSVGIILSGMGSDGTTGLRAIKEKAGLALVQEPGSAKFDSMPRSAIDAGLADIVAPAEELPGKIMGYLAHPLVIGPGLSLEPKVQSALEKITILLRDHSGHDFSLYKKNTVYRRIERRMGIHQIDKIASYVRFLQENPQELGLLFKELLIGVTSFFRDPEEWRVLKEKTLPSLLTGWKAGKQLKAWVVGCSTGEEAYSLAIVLKEAMEEAKLARRFPIQIFATDIDRDAIDKARQGTFPDNITADVSAERLSRFFVKEERGYRVSKEIREMVVFAEQNVIKDPPFTRLDILTCRNLLIYLTPEVQKKLLPLFYYSLNPGGVLFLGNAETIGTFTDLFSPVSSKLRIYKRLDSAIQVEPVEFPVSFVKAPKGTMYEPGESRPALNIQALADQLLLQRYSPAAVLTNDKGDILYITGRTGKYLEPAAGKANWNIFAMAREGLRYELAGVFRKALLQKEGVVLRGLNVRTNGSVQAVDLIVQVIEKPEGLRGMVMVVFTDVASLPETKTATMKGRPAAHNARVVALEDQLRAAREELQSCREEMQTSQEEAKSVNEELQSANEELQSANEELTTSKEELQSLNEELQTVNAELQARVDGMSRAENDWVNLLNSTDIATLFLDNDLRVRRFTTQATKIIKLIPGDVDRPITDLATDLDYPEMVADARNVLKTLVFVEKEVATRNGRWFAVRIMPYRTLDNRIDGIVITFTDITVAKDLEAKLRQALPLQRKGNNEEGQKK